MKLLIILCLVAVVVAAPPPVVSYPSEKAQLLRTEYNSLQDGIFNYYYEQTDGQRASQSGYLKNEGTDEESLSVSGEYSWVGPDGITYVVKYTADEDGYKPEIEQGPGGGVPPAVVASLLG